MAHPNYSSDSFQAVLKRLDAIEAFIGLNAELNPGTHKDTDWQWNDDSNDPLMSSLWISLSQLKKTSRQTLKSKVWSHDIIKQLWLG